MKTAVVYKSVSGFTRKYAEWISEELGCDIYELSRFTGKKIKTYDAFIYGGPLHAVGISGLKSFRSRIGKADGKKVIIYACGASPENRKVLSDIERKNFPEQRKENISFHYLRGGFNYSKLNLTNRLIMSMMRNMLEKKKDRTEEEQQMLDSYDNPVDFTQRENIKPLIEELLT